jgi:hypothetical protein
VPKVVYHRLLILQAGERRLSTETTASTPLKFSVLRLALAFVIAGVSDVIGAFASLAPPIGRPNRRS